MKKNTVYLLLTSSIKKMLRMAAAREGVTLTEYVSRLVEADCEKNGIAEMVNYDKTTEVQNGKQ